MLNFTRTSRCSGSSMWFHPLFLYIVPILTLTLCLCLRGKLLLIFQDLVAESEVFSVHRPSSGSQCYLVLNTVVDRNDLY